jgi:hypothetical protein
MDKAIRLSETDEASDARNRELRDYLDAEDEDVVAGGYSFPSPERMQWALKTARQRQAFGGGLLNDKWEGVSRFHKAILGVKVSAGVQDEWRLYQADIERLDSRLGKDDNVTKLDRQRVAGGFSKEFQEDFALSVLPRYARFKEMRPFLRQREAWESFESSDGTKLMERAEKFWWGFSQPINSKQRKKLKEEWRKYVDEQVSPALLHRVYRSDFGFEGKRGVQPILEAGGLEFIEGWFGGVDGSY